MSIQAQLIQPGTGAVKPRQHMAATAANRLHAAGITHTQDAPARQVQQAQTTTSEQSIDSGLAEAGTAQLGHCMAHEGPPSMAYAATLGT